MRLKTAQGDFEYADLGPNAGEMGPRVSWKMPGKLKRSGYTEQNEGQAPGIEAATLQGVRSEPEEKVSDFDDSIFSGDPTQLMPLLRRIHKLGMADAGTLGIEDVDALGQSPGKLRPNQISRAMSDRPVDPGPGYGADHSSLGVAPSEPEGDGHGDLPIEEPQMPSSKEVFKRHVGGLRKNAAGVLSSLIPDWLHSDPVGLAPTTPSISREEQRALLERAAMEALMRGGEDPTEDEPVAMALAGPDAMEGVQYARIVDEDVERANRRLVKHAEPPPPKGVSVKEWDKILARGPQKKAHKLQGETEVQGLPIAIENRAGSIRKGTDRDGHRWKTRMSCPYGYLKGTKGADGEPVDVFVGPKKDAPEAYVVHQHKPDGTGYDEDKVILGVESKEEAKELYLDHYDDPKFLGPISEVSVERLKDLVASKKPLVKISRASYAAMLQELQKLAEKEPSARTKRKELWRAVTKSSPAIGALIGAGWGLKKGLRGGGLASKALEGVGTGTLVGSIPEMMSSGAEAWKRYREKVGFVRRRGQ